MYMARRITDGFTKPVLQKGGSKLIHPLFPFVTNSIETADSAASESLNNTYGFRYTNNPFMLAGAPCFGVVYRPFKFKQ